MHLKQFDTQYCLLILNSLTLDREEISVPELDSSHTENHVLWFSV